MNTKHISLSVMNKKCFSQEVHSMSDIADILSAQVIYFVFTKTKNNKTNSTNLYPQTEGYLRETCKSQNINPIYLNLKFTFSIIMPVKYVLFV